MKMIKRVLTTFVLVLPALSSAQVPSRDDVRSSRDPRALEILTSCMKVGGGQAVGRVKDYASSGMITHYWGGAAVEGRATMEGRGTREFRLDSLLNQGTRSTVIGSTKSVLREQNGNSHDIPAHNSINMGAMNFPFLAILEAINDNSTTISFVGEIKVGEQTNYQIRVARNFSAQGDREGILSKLSTKDFFIDSATLLPVAVRWMTHPPDDYRQEIPQQIAYADFRKVDGVLVPFSVTETIYGQRTWSFQAESVKLNVGLTQEEFEK